MHAHTPASEDADPTVAELVAARPHLTMHPMDGLILEDVPLNAIADALGTPAWVLATYLTISALNAQFEHANIRLPPRLDWWMRLLFVTPNMHKVHHSRHLPETDNNYSNLLSIWDRLGRTYNRGPYFAELHYGLEGFDDEDKQSLPGLLKMPFMSGWGRAEARADEKATNGPTASSLPSG